MGAPADRRRLGDLRIAAAISLLAAGIAVGGPAAAGSFQVNPVNIALPANRQSTSLTVRNSDTEAVSVHVVTYRWTQENGRDVYSPTGNVIASPPIFTIAPGAVQLVRIGLKTRTGGAYRVILEEIPRQQRTGAQIQVALRLNLPLYLLPAGHGEAALSWTAWRDGSGGLFVEGRNSGSLHAQVLELAAATETGRRTILSQEMGVILPNSARRWKIGNQPGFRAGAPVTLEVRSPAGATKANLLVEQR
jgi:fimbrial chaperone protein